MSLKCTKMSLKSPRGQWVKCKQNTTTVASWSSYLSSGNSSPNVQSDWYHMDYFLLQRVMCLMTAMVTHSSWRASLNTSICVQCARRLRPPTLAFWPPPVTVSWWDGTHHTRAALRSSVSLLIGLWESDYHLYIMPLQTYWANGSRAFKWKLCCY